MKGKKGAKNSYTEKAVQQVRNREMAEHDTG